MKRNFDLLIVGLGVTGTALLWVLSKFTNIKNIAAIEKNGSVALVNSHPLNNAQTSHDGGTETNYVLPKALVVQKAARMLRAYVQTRGNRGGLFRITHRMVLAVGEREVAQIRARFEEFSPHYPDLRLVEADELRRIEPMLMRGRNPNQPVCALVSEEGYAINYQVLAETLLNDALDANPDLDIRFNTKVEEVRREDGNYVVATNNGEISARVVVFAAGAYSLHFAHRLGYGLNLGILSVAGSFFSGGPLVRGKVYRPQVAGRPFAEIHVDPDVLNENDSRFGPTTKPILLMERYRYGTFRDYLRQPIVSLKGLWVTLKILIENGLLGYVARNFIYDIPILGKLYFLHREARALIPTMRYSDLKRRKNAGGVRPQIVDLSTGKLEMGERTIARDNLIFNTTPSPGASVCIYNAVMRDVPQVVEYLGSEFWFDSDSFYQELGISPE
jgi:malate dehydrogenase (quinone)